MIRDLKNLYVAIKNNKVVLFETNLKSFVSEFKKMESGVRSLGYYQRGFKESDFLSHVNKNGDLYLLQKAF